MEESITWGESCLGMRKKGGEEGPKTDTISKDLSQIERVRQISVRFYSFSGFLQVFFGFSPPDFREDRREVRV